MLRRASTCERLHSAFAGLLCRPDASTVAGRPVQVFISCYVSTAGPSGPRPSRTRPPSRPPIPTQTTISSAPIITFRRLLPSGDPVTAEEIVTGLGLHERSGGVPLAGTGSGGRTRPYVVLNMAATLDGRATLQGRSGPISGPADRALFHGLRSVVDAVMAGAGTMRTERYGPIVPDPAVAACAANAASMSARSRAWSPRASPA